MICMFILIYVYTYTCVTCSYICGYVCVYLYCGYVCVYLYYRVVWFSWIWMVYVWYGTIKLALQLHSFKIVYRNYFYGLGSLHRLFRRNASFSFPQQRLNKVCYITAGDRNVFYTRSNNISFSLRKKICIIQFFKEILTDFNVYLPQVYNE